MKWIKHFFKPKKKSPKSRSKMPMTAGEAQNMLRMIKNTQEQELSCDEVFELLDTYADMAARGEDVKELFPLVEHHLEMCPDCREEYEAVMRILEKNID